MQPENYFHDGYTQAGYIEAAPRMHGALRFTFRPALVEERSQLGEAAAVLKAPLYDRQAAAFTAQKIVVWDLSDVRGDAVPISGEAMLRLQPDLFVKLHRIVLGWAASDLDPAWPSEVAARALDEEASAALSEQSIGAWREEHDEKN